MEARGHRVRDGERHDKREIDFSPHPEPIFLSTYKLFLLLTPNFVQREKLQQLICLSERWRRRGGESLVLADPFIAKRLPLTFDG